VVFFSFISEYIRIFRYYFNHKIDTRLSQDSYLFNLVQICEISWFSSLFVIMKQELRLEQKQILTPQLLLNLKLLVLPNLELEILIRNELEQNPVLEIIIEGAEEIDKNLEISEIQENKDEFDIADLISDDTYSFPLPSKSVSDITEIKTAAKTTFEDTLLPIVKSLLSENDIPIAEYIIGNITDDGFLPIPIQEISNTLNTNPDHIKEIINIIQQIEPCGIASQNLQEALLCQLEVLGYDKNSLEFKVVHDYYDVLLKRHYSNIAKALGVTDSDLMSAILNIQTLETRPARRYLNIPAEYISPDFSIEWRDDNLIGNINDETIPVLRIAHRFRDIVLHPKDFTSEEVNFARTKLQNALNLIKAIESRKKLLRRILQYIISTQHEFFINGKEFIKPISIKNTAEFLGVHISTLSRACSGKYVETPVGIYPLKFFFTTGIGEHSRHSIKEKIQNLVNGEDKNKPYTDDEIVTLLTEQNIKLSRRTIAKYREELNIPGSNDRSAKR